MSMNETLTLEHRGCRLSYNVRGKGPPVLLIQGVGLHGACVQQSRKAAITCSLIPKRYFQPRDPELNTTRMNEQPSKQAIEAVAAALPARQLSPFRPAKSRRPCNAQIALPAVPRRQLRRMCRAFLAALRAAEFAEWQASGGDFLSSRQQPVYSTTECSTLNSQRRRPDSRLTRKWNSFG